MVKNFISNQMSLFDTHQEDTDEEENHVNKQEQTDNDDIAFIAKLKSSRTLASILKTIHFADVSSVILHSLIKRIEKYFKLKIRFE